MYAVCIEAVVVVMSHIYNTYKTHHKGKKYRKSTLKMFLLSLAKEEREKTNIYDTVSVWYKLG